MRVETPSVMLRMRQGGTCENYIKIFVIYSFTLRRSFAESFQLAGVFILNKITTS